MDTTTLNSMCRCCAAEGMFKDIKTSYHWMGEEEVYGDMLRECFDVKLVSVEDGGICEVCITQLRNASNFKKQVLHTEKKFKRILDSRQFKPTEVKEEVSGDENSSSEDNENDRDVDNDNIDDEDYVPDFEMPIKTESPEESKSRKRGAKATTSRAKKSRVADDEDKSTKPKAKKPVTATVKKKKIITIQTKETPPVRIVFKKCLELSKHQMNIRTLLLCSNATPIRRYGGVGYMCCFCTQEFPEPRLLKAHTLQSHDESAKRQFMSAAALHSYVVKLDITGLRCALCRRACASVDELATHLTAEHGRQYHRDVRSRILPFSFGEALACAECDLPFGNFKVLLEHMNVHFGNHICEVCGRGFVNKKVFQTHTYRHGTGSFDCPVCGKVFSTRVKCKEHQRATHVLGNRRSRCGYCGERFADYAKKHEHEVSAHGAAPRVLPCRACGKAYGNQRALTVHTKTHHLMEKRTK